MQAASSVRKEPMAQKSSNIVLPSNSFSCLALIRLPICARFCFTKVVITYLLPLR